MGCEAYNTLIMGDIIFFHQVLQQPDAVKHVKALIKELHENIENKRWNMIQCSSPQRHQCDTIIWAMQYKRNHTNNKVTNYKSSLNIHGGHRVMQWIISKPIHLSWHGLQYIYSSSPWFNFLVLHQVDFFQAYPQAPIEADIYIELPKGGSSRDHVLVLLSNLYGQKQAGCV